MEYVVITRLKETTQTYSHHRPRSQPDSVICVATLITFTGYSGPMIDTTSPTENVSPGGTRSPGRLSRSRTCKGCVNPDAATAAISMPPGGAAALLGCLARAGNLREARRPT